MHSKKLTAVLSAVAFTLTAAASASSVITLAEEAKTCETEITTQTVAETQETVSAVTMDVEGYEEEEADTELPEETETEQETVPNKEDSASRAEEEKIRLAESRAALASSVIHVDVGNRAGHDVAVTDFPYTETAYADNEQALWDLFKSLGFTDAGAAGAMGNLAMESGLKPSSRSKNFDYANGTGGGGLAGWMCGGRFKTLMSMAEKNGVSWQDLSVQMAFLQYELENTRKNVGQRMKTETDVDMAADYFCVYFEGCVGHSASPQTDGISAINGKWYQGLTKRKALARGFYEKYAGSTP